MAIILIMAGIVIFLNGAFMCTLANMTFGIVLTILLGLFLICWGLFYKKIAVLTQKGAGKVIKIAIISLLCVELAFVMFIAGYGRTDTAAFDEDCVIVLGAGIRGEWVTYPLKTRLDWAVEYNKKNPDAVIVVTGAQGFGEIVTEAYAMEKYLLSQGVPGDKIIKEEKATSTRENMRFSKAILDNIFDREYKTVIITNNFHIYRGVTYAKMEGLGDVTHLGGRIKLYNIIPSYIRESLAILKLWVFE